MELQVINSSGQAAGSVNVTDTTFDRELNEALVHQVVTAYLAGGRAGTRAQKTRSDVRGGGAKPWRQKGTGRARAGTSRSPIWRSGGVTFAARPQNHAQKVNRKMYRGAMRAILSELVRQQRFVVVDELRLAEPKTKQALALLNGLGLGDAKRVLLINAEPEQNLELAVRNIHGVQCAQSNTLNPVALVDCHKVAISKDALNKLEEWLA